MFEKIEVQEDGVKIALSEEEVKDLIINYIEETYDVPPPDEQENFEVKMTNKYGHKVDSLYVKYEKELIDNG